MIDILVCVGSCCHLKGSHEVIETYKRLIKENTLKEQVGLKASFCLGHCTNGVSVKINGDFISDMTKENCEDKFKEYVLDVI
jgi:NADH:ubiquinone oxidoreductase subunit E